MIDASELVEGARVALTPVCLESPYAGDVSRNLRYARAAVRDCFVTYHEAAIASHLLYTQPGILDDQIPIERSLGIEAGLLWGAFAQRTVVYMDLGISNGMKLGIERAHRQGRRVDMRTLPEWQDGRDPTGPLFDPVLHSLHKTIEQLHEKLGQARARLSELGDNEHALDQVRQHEALLAMGVLKP